VSGLAFRDVFDAQYDYVWSSLRRLGVFDGDLEDITDEVFIRIHENLGAYDGQRPLRPWLFAFAFRAAADYRRLARHRIRLGFEGDDEMHGDPSPEEALVQKESAELVQNALDAISMNNRAVFVMYEIDGTEMKDIASTLGIPLQTAYSRLRLARATFEVKLRELRGFES
jgi:RNA polymerase sigma-70 factor (ECF subfamily)